MFTYIGKHYSRKLNYTVNKFKIIFHFFFFHYSRKVIFNSQVHIITSNFLLTKTYTRR